LVDNGATLSIVPCTADSAPSGPLLKVADGQPIPSWGFIQKTVQFQGKLFTSSFLQATVVGPILGIDFLRKFKVTVAPEISQIHFACTTSAFPISSSLFSAASSCLPSTTLVPAPVPVQLPARTSSTQPPAICAHVVRNPEVKSSSFSLREYQSLLDIPPFLQNIPNSVPANFKLLLQKHPTILVPGMCCPSLPMALSITFMPVANPPFSQNPAALIHKSWKLPKQNSKV
jgi:hypothetical protein